MSAGLTRDQLRAIANGPDGKRRIEQLRAMAQEHHDGAVERLAKFQADYDRLDRVRIQSEQMLADIAFLTGEVRA